MLLKSIYLENLLSYATGMERLELGPLNVLIGPNASGKSNLIEAISLLAAAPKDLLAPIREGGGIMEWLWKGGEQTPIASLDAIFSPPPQGINSNDIRYHLEFKATTYGGLVQRPELADERIESASPRKGESKPFIYYAYQHGHPVLNYFENDGIKQRKLRQEDVSVEKSILSQRRDADLYPELNYLASQLEQIRFYREWNLGRYTAPRLPQRADLPDGFLLENASNLGLVVNNLRNRPATKKRLLELLQKFYAGVEDITTQTQGNTIQVFFHETGLREPVPATRLSDGTLRYLCLLTILCHPTPPPLICLEEPELGIHPDILPTIAELLQECAERTQLIVTTHSEIIVDVLTDMPEAVIVCEKDSEQGTQLKRLTKGELEDWLKKYSLGQLWSKGAIGGNRW
jgi:predicted ATPase